MRISIQLLHLDLEAEGCHLFINATLNGKAARLLLDTGASKTVFDLNRISRFVRKKKAGFDTFEKQSTGLGTSSMESLYTTAKEFSIDKLSIKNFCVILLNMKHVNHSYKMIGAEPIDGVLGSDLLNKYQAVIDYKKMILKLSI